MNRQTTAAPTSEIAIGRKIIDFATGSPRRRRSASVAKTSPTLTADQGNQHDPAQRVADRAQHALVGEQEPVVVEADEALGPGVPEADDDRVDHRVDEEDGDDHQRRPDEHVRPHAARGRPQAGSRRHGPSRRTGRRRRRRPWRWRRRPRRSGWCPRHAGSRTCQSSTNRTMTARATTAVASRRARRPTRRGGGRGSGRLPALRPSLSRGLLLLLGTSRSTAAAPAPPGFSRSDSG